MSEIQPKDLFSDTHIQETTKLRYERVLDEPKTQCTRCGAELILSRLPWQSRCLKCKEAWTAMAVFQYHTQVVGLVPRLPWNHHLRMGFSVQAQVLSVPQRQVPQWGAASSFPPPHPQYQTQASAPAVVPGPPPQEQSEDGSQGDAEKFPEEEPSEETKAVPSDRVSDILPDAVKLLSSAQLTFNNFLSGRGNSEWVRGNLSAVQEYLSILRNLRREVQQVIEDHQEALRRLNDQENLVDALDTLMPEIQEALAEEDQKTQAASSSSGTPSTTHFLSASGSSPKEIFKMIKSGKLSPQEKAELMKALSEEDDEADCSGKTFLRHQ